MWAEWSQACVCAATRQDECEMNADLRRYAIVATGPTNAHAGDDRPDGAADAPGSVRAAGDRTGDDLRST